MHKSHNTTKQLRIKYKKAAGLYWTARYNCLNQLCVINILIGRRGERVLEDEDDGVASQEHFRDESVLVDWLGLLLAT